MSSDTANQRAEDYIKTQLIAPARQTLKGFSLYNKVLNLPEGKMSVVYEKVGEVGDPLTTFGIPIDELDINLDAVSITPYTKSLPVTVKGFKLSKEQIAAFESEGKDLTTQNIISSIYSVGKRRDDIIFAGWSKDGSAYNVPGFLNLTAPNTESTSKVTSTAGNMISKIGLMLDKVYEDNIEGCNFNLGMARGNYAELIGNLLSDGSREFPHCVDMINPESGMPKGKLYWSHDITSNYCVMSPVDPMGRFMELAVAIDMDTIVSQFGPLGKYNPTQGYIIDAFYPIVYDENAICVGSGL